MELMPLMAERGIIRFLVRMVMIFSVLAQVMTPSLAGMAMTTLPAEMGTIPSVATRAMTISRLVLVMILSLAELEMTTS